MTYQRRREVVETMTGEGKIHDEHNQFVARVGYDIKVEQTTIVSETQQTPGLKTYSGRIEVIEGEKDLISEDWGDLTLHLSDGRTLLFFVKHGDPYSGAYQVLGSRQELGGS